MRRLSDTIQRLAKTRLAMAVPPPIPSSGSGRLEALTGFGSNPGNLLGWIHVPPHVAERPALVVVLHGCTQNAASYDASAGWSRLADRHGFVVLYPEQQRANNPNLCFNWFTPEDTRRDAGEVASIRQMIDAVVRAHGIDPAQIFVNGLSAGGAMTSALLAAYPELFAGGAIIAGLPHGSAINVTQALDRMRGHGRIDADALASSVRRASGHTGRWPRVSIWHGGGDKTVHPDNAEAILAQWQALHGVGEAAAHETRLANGIRRRQWQDGAGSQVIEDWVIPGMGHGTPLDPAGGSGEVAGPHMLDAGISSTGQIAAFWGLADGVPAIASTQDAKPRASAAPPMPEPARQPGGPAQIIEEALRASGLLR